MRNSFEDLPPRMAERSLSNFDRQIIDSSLGLLEKYRSPANIETADDRELEICYNVLRQLTEKYTMEVVWDRFICGDSNTTSYQTVEKKSATEATHKLLMQESADSNSFEALKPSYDFILGEDDKARLSEMDSANALLLGSRNLNSANQFNRYIHDINPKIDTTIVDMGMSALKNTDQGICKIEGNIAQLPLKDDSEELVFTNFSIDSLIADDSGLANGRDILNMLSEAYRVLKPGGLLVMAERSPEPSGKAEKNSISQFLLLFTLKIVGFENREISRADKQIGDTSQANVNTLALSRVDDQQLSRSSQPEPKLDAQNPAFVIKATKLKGADSIQHLSDVSNRYG